MSSVQDLNFRLTSDQYVYKTKPNFFPLKTFVWTPKLHWKHTHPSHLKRSYLADFHLHELSSRPNEFLNPVYCSSPRSPSVSPIPPPLSTIRKTSDWLNTNWSATSLQVPNNTTLQFVLNFIFVVFETSDHLLFSIIKGTDRQSPDCSPTFPGCLVSVSGFFASHPLWELLEWFFYKANLFCINNFIF